MAKKRKIQRQPAPPPPPSLPASLHSPHPSLESVQGGESEKKGFSRAKIALRRSAEAGNLLACFPASATKPPSREEGRSYGRGTRGPALRLREEAGEALVGREERLPPPQGTAKNGTGAAGACSGASGA
ncbi:hypothetical protein Emag_001265 [Eimeria magna]